MERVYYVQRLNAPQNQVNPFSFGGEKLNGGISKESMQILKSIFSFDYMGSAEFEWGAIPTALNSMLEAKLSTATLTNGVFILAPEAIMNDVISWVETASFNPQRLKEHLGLQEALAKSKFAKTKGWLKIEDSDHCEEPFMFFVDEEMFNKTCEVLGY